MARLAYNLERATQPEDFYSGLRACVAIVAPLSVKDLRILTDGEALSAAGTVLQHLAGALAEHGAIVGRINLALQELSTIHGTTTEGDKLK